MHRREAAVTGWCEGMPKHASSISNVSEPEKNQAEDSRKAEVEVRGALCQGLKKEKQQQQPRAVKQQQAE